MAKAKYKKNSRGEYETKVWDGTYTPDGLKHRVRLSSKKSSADLERIVHEFNRSLRIGEITVESDILFTDYAREWLAVRKASKRTNTRTMYENIIEKHLSYLENIRLVDIRNMHFQMVINNAMDKPRTCQQIYITFCQIIRKAVVDNLITSQNADKICTDINLPRYQKKEKRPLNEVEKQAFNDCMKNCVFTNREKAFLVIIYYCGLRRCEALALTRFDFKKDSEGFYLSISKDLVFAKNEPLIEDKTKSDRGNRQVPVPAVAAEYLNQYISNLPGANLFYSNNSKLITKSSYDKMWASIVRKMNTAAGGTKDFPVIDDLTAHIFRHNYCSNLCYKIPAISIKMIARLMGDTEKVVMDVYNHVMEEKEDVHTVICEALSI